MKIDYKDKKYIYSILVEAWILHIQWLNATNMKKKLEKQEENNQEEVKKDEEEEKKNMPISKPVVKFNPSITYFFY
jgi:hypothetical protein